MYERVVPLLARSHRAVAMDTPGFGLSDPPAAPPGDMRHYARAAIGLLDGLEMSNASVVAVRTGASIAIELATTVPQRIDKLILTGLVAIATEDERGATLAAPSREAVPWSVDGHGEFLNSHVLSWVRYFAREDDGEQYLRELIAKLQAGPNFAWAYEAVVNYDAWDRLPRLVQPTLFLNPVGDPGYEDAKVYQRRVPRSRYVEMPGEAPRTPGWAGAPAAYPDQYAAAILEFLRNPSV
jgi:pimeloyl-ACP methyl ester carboxylesterase